MPKVNLRLKLATPMSTCPLGCGVDSSVTAEWPGASGAGGN